MKKNWENACLEVSQEEIAVFLKDFEKTLMQKLNKKGHLTFFSTQEVMGKMLEEFLEAQEEAHNRDLAALKDELMDCALVGFWGFVSANKWKKTSK